MIEELEIKDEAATVWRGPDAHRFGLEMADILSTMPIDEDALVVALLYRSIRIGRLQLRDVTSILANERVNLTGMSTQTNTANNTAGLQLSIEVDGLSQFSQVLDSVQQINNVIAAKRIRSG